MSYQSHQIIFYNKKCISLTEWIFVFFWIVVSTFENTHQMTRFNFAIYHFFVLNAVSNSVLSFLTTIINREKNGNFSSIYGDVLGSFFAHVSIIHKHEIMFKMLCITIIDSLIKSIIAINNFNMKLIQFFIKYLNNHVLQNFKKLIQCFENSFIHVNAWQITDLIKYKKFIAKWQTLVKHIVNSFSNMISISTRKVFKKSKSNVSIVNVILFFSIMISLKAVS